MMGIKARIFASVRVDAQGNAYAAGARPADKPAS
jgi:hypothetical protein